MANKIISFLTDILSAQSLEVYRDISLTADINLANILKTYRQVVPMAYLANNVVIGYIDQFKNDKYVAKDKLTAVFNVDSNNPEYLYHKSQYVVLAKHDNSSIDKITVDGVLLSAGWKCQFINDVKVKNITTENIRVDDYPINTNELTNVFLHGDMSALTYVKAPMFINAQYDDTYYEEVYGDAISNYVLFLEAECKDKQQGLDYTVSALITELSINTVTELREILTLLLNEGAISSFNNWIELQHWNPYKLAKLVNVKAVFNSLHNIFTWTPGERILNPEFGNNLKRILYQGITEFTTEQIISEIRRCISEYEPRVRVLDIINASNVNDTENNTIQINILFSIPTLSEEQFIYSYKYNQYDL